MDLSKDFIEMPEGMNLDDLGYDTLEDEVWPVIAKVNKRFLGKILSGLLVVPDPEEIKQVNKSSDNSTKQSSG